MQERLKETRGLNVSLVVDTVNVKGFVIPVTVSIYIYIFIDYNISNASSSVDIDFLLLF